MNIHGTPTMIQLRLVHSTRKRKYGIEFYTSNTCPTIVYVIDTKQVYLEPMAEKQEYVYRTTHRMTLFTI
jgi:hypothetical protein